MNLKGRLCKRNFAALLAGMCFILLIVFRDAAVTLYGHVVSLDVYQKGLLVESGGFTESNSDQEYITDHGTVRDRVTEKYIIGEDVPQNSSYRSGNFQHPSRHISCFQNLTASFLAELSELREKVIQEGVLLKSFPKKAFATNTDVADATDVEYFEKLKSYKNIGTVLFRASTSSVEACMLKDYFPVYVVKDCDSVLPIAKRHEQYKEAMYNMVCDGDLEKSLQPSPFAESSFQISLPRGYHQAADVKTVTYIHVIRHAIVSVYGDVYTADVTVTPHRCYPNNKENVTDEVQASLKVVDEVFMLAQFFGSGMFHGNVEGVSRIAFYVPFLEKNPTIKIHVMGKVPVFMSMFGFDESRFVTSTVKAKIVYMPAGTGCCLPNLITTQLQSFYMRRSLPNDLFHRDTIVLIKRTPHRNRFFKKQSEIREMLSTEAAKFGFKVWEFGDKPVPPLTESAAMFNRAVMVVAPHGAGEANLLFSQPGTVLIESLCFDKADKKVNLVFRNVAYVVGGHYYGFYKNGKHCTHTTAEDLRRPVLFYLERIKNNNVIDL